MKKFRFEPILLILSITAILVSYFVAGLNNVLYLSASLVGAVMLIFLAMGNIMGPILTLVFSILYAIISYEYAYYGEMITYIGMTGIISLIAIITWHKNPSKNNKKVVKISKISLVEWLILLILSIVITSVFYLILGILNTQNLVVSCVSVFTSFVASYLEMRRSPYYAIAFAINDVVLITLWALAMRDNPEYLSMLICFIVFLINDIYGFISWKRREVSATCSE